MRTCVVMWTALTVIAVGCSPRLENGEVTREEG